MLVATEKFAQDAFTAIAYHRASDSARGGDTQSGRPGVVALVHPEQKPSCVETTAVFTGDIKIGAASYTLRRSKTKAALRGVRQR